MKKIITASMVLDFQNYLIQEERSNGTREKYQRDLAHFTAWLDGRPVSKELAAAWKEALLEQGYAPIIINSMLAAIHQFFAFMGWTDCRVKYLRVQQRLFRDTARDLDRREYDRLIECAQRSGKDRLALLMETMGSTGIRVSEVHYLTVEAVRKGRTDISLKGKIRTILLPSKLCRKLLKYAQKEKIASGEIFLTRNGISLSRKQIWSEMKALCAEADVAPSKVFPHNLRHLFARTFYHVDRDVAKLADILGHSSIETTRIYLISTGVEHVKTLDRLHLVS